MGQHREAKQFVLVDLDSAAEMANHISLQP